MSLHAGFARTITPTDDGQLEGILRCVACQRKLAATKADSVRKVEFNLNQLAPELCPCEHPRPAAAQDATASYS